MTNPSIKRCHILIQCVGVSLLLGLVMSCQKPHSDMLIIDNVQGYSFDGARQLFQFSALAIHGGRVVATGDGQLKQKYRGATVLDGNGKTLLPGLIDGHGHVSWLGYTPVSYTHLRAHET